MVSSIDRLYLILVCVPPLLCQSPPTESVSQSPTDISNIEIFHLFFTIHLCLWLLFLVMTGYGIYRSIPNNNCLKSLLVGDRNQQISHTFTLTIIACEPSIGYDYDNTSIRIDLCDRNDELIASLLMRPLWAFNSIQTSADSTAAALANAPKASPTTDVTHPETNNLSREAPLIGVYKMVTDRNINKVSTIVMAHDCPHPNSTILVRCVEISNITSLISHTYPVNGYIPNLSEPMTFSFGTSNKSQFEFDSSHDMPRKLRYQTKSSLDLIERAVFWLVCLNLIILCSLLWSWSYGYESDEWLMWYKAVLLSLILGALVSVIHLLITVPYRLYKEYYVFHPTLAVRVLKYVFLAIVLLMSAILSTASLAIARDSIKLTIFLRWYRIAFLTSIVFICVSTVLTLIGGFVHIRPKPRNENSFNVRTLEVPKMGDKQNKYEMIELDCGLIEISNLKNLSIFGSVWLRSALHRHNQLDRAILCDIYDVTFLPNGQVVTNFAENAVKIFGKENIAEKSRGKAYATRLIQQKGMAVSVSQYGRKRDGQKKSELKKKNSNDNEFLLDFNEPKKA